MVVVAVPDLNHLVLIAHALFGRERSVGPSERRVASANGSRRDEWLVIVDDNHLVDSSGRWGWSWRRGRRGSGVGRSSGSGSSDGGSIGSVQENIGCWPRRKSSGRMRMSGSSGTLSKEPRRWRPVPVEVSPTSPQVLSARRRREVGSDVQLAIWPSEPTISYGRGQSLQDIVSGWGSCRHAQPSTADVGRRRGVLTIRVVEVGCVVWRCW